MITNRAIGEKVNLLQMLNSKLEAGVLQTELALEAAASASGQAVRYNEFINQHGINGVHSNNFLTNAMVSASAGIYASKIDNHMNYQKSTPIVPSATAATNGTAVVLTPATNYKMIVPLGSDIVFGGTFGSETVTVTSTITYSDATTTTATYTATATGTTSLTNSQLMALNKDGVYITSISVVAKSTIASTAATVTLNRYGLYL